MKLVVGVDLDEPGAAPVKWAVALAQVTGAGLEVVHVTDRAPGGGGLQLLRARRPEAESRIVDEARREVAEYLEQVEGLPKNVPISVLAGRPSETLAGWARSVRDGVLVVGPGRRHWLQTLVGTTTDRLLRTSSHPVLVGRGEPTSEIAHVLAAVELGDGAERVASEAARWAYRLGARLTLFHVPQARWSNAFLEGRGDHELDEMYETPEEMRERARDGLRRLAELVDREGLEVETEVGEPGVVPVEGVTTRLSQGDVDLAVTGTHGVSAVDRMILGSVAEGVIQKASGPVLVVPVGH